MEPELTATDIPWTLAPAPTEAVEDEPIVDVLLDAIAYRTLMQEALHALAALTTDHRRLKRRYHHVLRDRRERR